jgi:hypothetical protein
VRKVFSIVFVVISLLVTGCTIQVDGKGISNFSSTENQNQIQIQAQIDKMYEDGVDFKVQLTGVKTAKGTWTVKYYESTNVLKNQGSTAIAGYNFGDLGVTDKPNNENDVNLYVSFDGIADGQKIKLDKIHVVTKEEFNQAPLVGDGGAPQPFPTENMTWEQLKSNMQSGYLLNPNVFLAATKDQVIMEMGEPDVTESSHLVYQNMTIELDEKQNVSTITVNQPNGLPQDQQEITKAFGEPYSSDGAAGTIYSNYKIEEFYFTIAWSNVASNVREIKFSTIKPY